MTPYYADQLVTLYLADSREWLPDADVIVTDPPYGISMTSGTGKHRNGSRARHGLTFPRWIAGDREPFDPAPLLARNRPMVLFGANHYADRLPASPSWLVWDKRDGMPSLAQADVELAWTNLGGPARLYREIWNGGGSRLRDERSAGGSPVRSAQSPGKTLHPAQKPLGLMRWVVGLCPAGTVLDPYAGSGTTLVAAKSLGRRSIGLELEERYCEVAARRCAQEILGLAQ